MNERSGRLPVLAGAILGSLSLVGWLTGHLSPLGGVVAIVGAPLVAVAALEWSAKWAWVLLLAVSVVVAADLVIGGGA